MPSRPEPSAVLRWTLLLGIWGLVAVAVGSALFLSSSRTTVLAGHDAVVTPTLEGHVVLVTGPVLPDVRTDVPGGIGVRIALGKTDVESTDELFDRYALIASSADAQIAKVQGLVVEMALASALRGLAVGAVPVLTYLLLGRARRRDLLQDLRTLRPRPLLGAGLVVAVVVALWQPWYGEDAPVDRSRSWIPLAEFLGDGVPLPEGARRIEVRADVTANQTKRLIASAVDTYTKSQEWYDAAAEAAAEVEVREPDEDETVVLLVSDRHDNVGMDRVARAVADRAGATGVLGAGDDTSTGKPWEAFSLDSFDRAFDDLDRWVVTGNHDHGEFVGEYFDDLGWTRLVGEVEEGPAGGRILGVGDPRSSGLGSWRDETGLTFGEVEERLAETACDSEERINTLLVHDVKLAREALERGCADLAVGGHLHVQNGPDEVVGPEGEVGYSWTNGTTGGAAYAIAVGSKPRRDAEMTLVTYDEDGVPVGLQWVRVRTDGRFLVGPWEELTYVATEEPGQAGVSVDDSRAGGRPRD
ncbi:metallophosphoesterase family protein [Nocardioides solisilvae]|uniref:metallophosphoesterase family protein n=1 Tax=Nocardioides solisilvae TaxID=1542435 RepID=UPI001951DEF0|nr:metallophosphoesterase [Nocardioides solisilvae]